MENCYKSKVETQKINDTNTNIDSGDVEQKEHCMQQLLSNASRKNAANAEALEQAERIHTMHLDQIHEQMLSNSARDLAAMQSELERERQLSDHLEATPKVYHDELIGTLNQQPAP